MFRPGLRLISGGRRRRLAAGLALIVAVVVVVVLVTSSGSPSAGNASANSGGGSSVATVARHNLVETDTESGTVSYANPQTVYNYLSGTITWLPGVGQVIKPGQTLYKVAGQPVILMDGTTPAYRALGPSDSDGQDILQLNRNLVSLGFDPDGIVVDNVWQAATTDGVEQLQESLGETETGSLSLGQVAFLPGPQIITTVDATLGGTGSGSSSPSGSSDTSAPADPKPEFVSLESTKPSTSGSSTTPTTTTPTTTTPKKSKTKGHSGASTVTISAQTLAALVALLKQQAAELAANKGSPGKSSGSPSSSGSPKSSGSPSSSDSGSPSSGDSSADATAILQTTSTQLVVTVDLAASSQSEAVVGEHVQVEMPAGNMVNGKITAVSSVAQNSNSGNNGNSGNDGNGSGNGSGATIPVTVSLRGHVSGAGLDQAAVSVDFVEAVANNVLSVPVTALLATGGGGYAVQEAAAPHKLIAVTTGLFAAGDVQISGAGIYPGLQVTDSQG